MFYSNFQRTLSLTLGTLAMVLLIAFAASAWTEPTAAPPGVNVSTPLNIGSTGQSKSGGLILNTGGAPNGLIVQSGNVGIGVPIPGVKLDISGDVRWSGTLQGGAVPWTRLNGIPAGFADGVDNTGITSETDPTVLASVKDGISWGEVSGRPAFNGCGGANLALKTLDLNTGATTCETDDIGGGGVSGSGTANYISKWTGGTSLGNSSLSDNGAGTISGIAGGVSIGSVSTGWYSDGANLAARFPGGAGAFYVQSANAGTTYMQSGAAAGGTSFPSGTVNISESLNVGSNIGIGAGKMFYSNGRMHIHGEENLYLLNKGGVIVSKAWGGNGNLTVEGALTLGGVSRTSWPSGGGSITFSDCGWVWGSYSYGSLFCPGGKVQTGFQERNSSYHTGIYCCRISVSP